MTSHCKLPPIAALVLSCLAAGAQQAEPTASSASAASAPAAPPLQKLRVMSLRPGGEAYPVALAEQGVQGTVELLVSIGADGKASATSVHSSSRSSALDERAQAFARGLRFGSTDKARAVPLPDVILPVEFRRDTLETLGDKTCREFNVDVAYFKATFPEADTNRMPVVSMTSGLLALGGLQGQGTAALVARARKLNAAKAGLVAACQAAPDANYLQTFTELVKNAG